MGSSGFLNLNSSPQNFEDLSFADRLSIVNVETSHSTCIQQYVSLNQTRRINCTGGVISKLYSYGVVPSSTPSNNFTQCPNIYGPSISVDIIECTQNVVDGEALTNYFTQHC